MDILTLFVVIPVLTMTGIILIKDMRQVRTVAAVGMSLQLLLAAVLIFCMSLPGMQVILLKCFL